LIAQVDDVQLVGADIAVHLIDVGYCDARYAGAVHFVTALKKRPQRYVDEPRVGGAARAEFKERVAWWCMALGRAAELCRWPATVLTETLRHWNNQALRHEGSTGDRRM
jgi:hypothetical protein